MEMGGFFKLPNYNQLPQMPKNRKSLIFVIFRASTKNKEIKDFVFIRDDNKLRASAQMIRNNAHRTFILPAPPLPHLREEI